MFDSLAKADITNESIQSYSFSLLASQARGHWVKNYLNPMCSHSLSHFLYTASVPVCPLMDLLARSIYTAALLTYSIPSGHFRKGSPCYRLWPALLCCCIYWFCLSVPLSSSERLSSSTHLMSPSKVDLVNIQTYWEHACMHGSY